MTKTIFYFLLLISLGVHSQELKKPETKKKNTLSVEFYQPIQNSIREFYNDDWVLNTYPTEKNNYSRSSFSNALGISYERIKNTAVFRVRLGITIREIKEHQDLETINTAEDFTTEVNQNFNYKQNHINIFVGVAKKIHLANNFDLDFGIDLASIYYLEGKGNYNYSVYQETILDNTLLYQQTITVADRIGKMYSFGFGPVFKPQYNINKNLVVSAELQVYFMKTFTDDKSTRLEISDELVQPDNITQHVEFYGDIKYDVTQWNWTKISPLLRIGYQF